MRPSFTTTAAAWVSLGLVLGGCHRAKTSSPTAATLAPPDVKLAENAGAAAPTVGAPPTPAGKPAAAPKRVGGVEDDVRAPLALRLPALSEEDPEPPVSAPGVLRPKVKTPPVKPAATVLTDLAAEKNADGRERLLADAEKLGNLDRASVLSQWFGKEPDAGLQTEIVEALGDVDGEESIRLSTLAAALDPNRPRSVRQAAVEALEGFDGPAAVPLWTALRRDRDFGTQAERALQRIGG